MNKMNERKKIFFNSREKIKSLSRIEREKSLKIYLRFREFSSILHLPRFPFSLRKNV